MHIFEKLRPPPVLFDKGRRHCVEYTPYCRCSFDEPTHVGRSMEAVSVCIPVLVFIQQVKVGKPFIIAVNAVTNI